MKSYFYYSFYNLFILLLILVTDYEKKIRKPFHKKSTSSKSIFILGLDFNLSVKFLIFLGNKIKVGSKRKK